MIESISGCEKNEIKQKMIYNIYLEHKLDNMTCHFSRAQDVQ